LVLGINHVPFTADFPEPILSGIVSNLHISSVFQAVWNDPTVLAVLEPGLEITYSGSYEQWDRDSGYPSPGLCDFI
jgi:hypothetical protein